MVAVSSKTINPFFDSLVHGVSVEDISNLTMTNEYSEDDEEEPTAPESVRTQRKDDAELE